MARRRYVSIKEVAARAGVSFQTASKVLNGGDVRVSAETAERILTAADELGYRPNTIARSLVQRTTATIGLVASDATDIAIAIASVAAEQEARRHGHSVLVGHLRVGGDFGDFRAQRHHGHGRAVRPVPGGTPGPAGCRDRQLRRHPVRRVHDAAADHGPRAAGGNRPAGRRPAAAVHRRRAGSGKAPASPRRTGRPRLRGASAPYRVRLWGLGNEMYGEWQVGAMSADEYVREATRWARALKFLDPGIELVSCGKTGWNEWDRIVIEGMAHLVDYHSIHIYTGSEDYWTNVLQPHQAERAIRSAIAHIRHTAYRHKIDSPAKIAYDEWNVCYRKMTVDLAERYAFADALAVGTYLNIFIRSFGSNNSVSGLATTQP